MSPENGRFLLRMDLHYDPQTHTMTAMLELPGMKRSDLSIVLSTNLNGVKQLVVKGRSTRPTFRDGEYVVKERKFGEYSRTLVVSHNTKVCASDVSTYHTLMIGSPRM